MIKKDLHIQTILYNSSKDLERFLLSLTKLETKSFHCFFYLVDQSENLDEYKKLKKILEKFEPKSSSIHFFISKQKNYGFGKGHNEIYRKNKAKYKDIFMLLNPDAILPFDFATNITKYLEQLENINWGLLELEQFPSEHPKYFNPTTLETNWTSGSGVIIKSKAFEKVGMFDENIFMYGEDVDLSIRMRISKYKVLHLPKARFTHLTKDTDVSKESDFTRIHKQAAELYLRYKFAKDRDIKKYLKLIGSKDPHREEILTKYNDMKKNLTKRTYYGKFLNMDSDYSNFRWKL